MINPSANSTDYLTFECDKCGSTFSHAIRLYHDAPTENDRQAYDVRNWIIAGIELQCPKCHEGMRFKLSLRPDLEWAPKQ